MAEPRCWGVVWINLQTGGERKIAQHLSQMGALAVKDILDVSEPAGPSAAYSVRNLYRDEPAHGHLSQHPHL